MKRLGMAMAAATALILGGCGGGEDGAPTAEENRQLDNAAEMLEELPSDSLTAGDDAALGNGEAGTAGTGELPVTGEAATNGAATNVQ
ncbi:MAG: hypothetical protein QOG72_1336 [Sphingomonadales bacterium]|jgi:hypothetical protein|nr:hypothetical protein [Sphingomonadales bacterium]